jgi:predicted O-methyltransferase YrrM
MNAVLGTIRRPGDPMVKVEPLTDIPFPQIDLAAYLNPVPAILDAPEFVETGRYFAEAASNARALLPPVAQALLYTVIRNQLPEHILEIGTFKGGSTESMARALNNNGKGTLHTVGPFDAEHFGINFRNWPSVLQNRTEFYPIDSMAFYMKAEERQLMLDLVLVDGNHDYEYASFDIHMAARFLAPGGFIFIDNISQVGPSRAAIDFIRANPDWIDCGMTPLSPTFRRVFDRERQNIPETDFFVFRAPRYRSVREIPQVFGNIGWSPDPVHGVRLAVPEGESSPSGTLTVECILRGFREDRIDEIVGEKTLAVRDNEGSIEIRFDSPLRADSEFQRYLVETWLMWRGEQPLKIAQPPTPF